MATLGTLAARALHDDFNATKYGTLARDAIKDALGTIYRSTSLARGDYVPAAITLTQGALGVTLTDTGLRISEVFLVGYPDRPLDERPVAEIAELQSPPAKPGRPTVYAITGAGLTTEGIQLVFAPIPDRAYQVQIVGHFAPPRSLLAADTDVIPLPEDYTRLPVYYARSELFSFEDDAQQAAYWLGKFDRGLKELREDLQVRGRRRRRRPSMWQRRVRGPIFPG